MVNKRALRNFSIRFSCTLYLSLRPLQPVPPYVMCGTILTDRNSLCWSALQEHRALLTSGAPLADGWLLASLQFLIVLPTALSHLQTLHLLLLPGMLSWLALQWLASLHHAHFGSHAILAQRPFLVLIWRSPPPTSRLLSHPHGMCCLRIINHYVYSFTSLICSFVCCLCLPQETGCFGLCCS